VWYAETKATDAPTVNFMQRHRVLNEATLNFCVPVHKEGKFAAAFCGVVKTSGIFKNISNFKLPPNSYSFLVTHGGEDARAPDAGISVFERALAAVGHI